MSVSYATTTRKPFSHCIFIRNTINPLSCDKRMRAEGLRDFESSRFKSASLRTLRSHPGTKAANIPLLVLSPSPVTRALFVTECVGYAVVRIWNYHQSIGRVRIRGENEIALTVTFKVVVQVRTCVE
eukprot:scaffold1147_cov126-Cylindrotheca_fusiformis.AAC.5